MFQSLAQSMLMLSLAAFDLAESFHFFVVFGLTSLFVNGLLGWFLVILKGYDSTWHAFQASINLISPANWLTEGMLYFWGSELDVTCSFRELTSSTSYFAPLELLSYFDFLDLHSSLLLGCTTAAHI